MRKHEKGAQKSSANENIFTIGHSTRTAEEFVELLKDHRIERIIDVRTIPRSRHNPQFNQAELRDTLVARGIGYTHVPELGGLRHPARDSPNTGWRSPAFRGFADYMQTEPFRGGLERVIVLAANERVALMCAEAVPWRCHRSLIADALALRGFSVCHILGASDCRPHVVTPWAHVSGRRIAYPPENASPRAGTSSEGDEKIGDIKRTVDQQHPHGKPG